MHQKSIKQYLDQPANEEAASPDITINSPSFIISKEHLGGIMTSMTTPLQSPMGINYNITSLIAEERDKSQ